MKFKNLLAVSLLGVSFLAACGYEPVKVTGVSLNESSVTCRTGEHERLVASIAPDNASNKSLTWTTSDSSVVTVDGGLVNCVAPGNASVTVTTVGGGFTASCQFTVVPNESVKKDGFLYSLNNASNGYDAFYIGDREATSIVMPDKIEGLPVKVIGRYSFAGMDKLESIKLPAELIGIGEHAFSGNSSLKSIKVGENDLSFVRVNDAIANNASLVLAEGNFEDIKMPYVSLGGSDVEGDIVVTFEDLKGFADSIEYSVAMNEASPYVAEGNLAVSDQPQKIKIGAHGVYRVNEITLKKGENVVDVVCPSEICVYTEEYNVAMLTATYPTTIFTLKAPTITKDGALPTYVLLERYAAFNWDNLQWNIRELPNIAHEDATAATNSRFFGYAHDWMKDYISDLYYANPESQFHFFFTDLSVDYFYYTVVAQGIEESLYDVVLLSDGTATASILCNTYGTWSQGNPSAKHASLMNSISKVKDHLFKNGWDPEFIKNNLNEQNGNKETYTGVPAYYFANHAYSTLCLFDNCEWWCNRLRAGENLKAINDVDPEFVNTILGTAGLKQNIYANSLLAGLSEADQVKFKTLFHFDSDSFDASREAGKKIMVILGTSWGGEKDNLYDYVKATMLYYGDEYDYYYKPHPGWPTSTCPERKVILDQLKADGFEIEEMDGAIAAEIIMYFNKDIYLSGYSSTTYQSLDETNNGMGACDWTTNTAEYTDYMFTYMAKATSEERTAYSLDASKTYYVVHVNSNAENAKMKEIYDVYDTAIINVTDSSVSYYKAGSPVTK